MKKSHVSAPCAMVHEPLSIRTWTQETLPSASAARPRSVES